MILRVFRLPGDVRLPMAPEYVGCKSWITLAEDISLERITPALSDEEFATRRNRIIEAVND